MTARMDEYVRRVVAPAPPLTLEQRARIAALLASPVDVISAPMVVGLDD